MKIATGLVALIALSACGGTPTPLADSPAANVAADCANHCEAVIVNSGNGNEGTVTRITLSDETAQAPIRIAGISGPVAISRDGHTAYVVSANRGFTSRQRGYVTPIDLATGKTSSPITVGVDPVAIAITPDGSTAYVANTNTLLVPDCAGCSPPPGTVVDPGATVTPIDLRTGDVGTPIQIATVPTSIAITTDGSTAYVTGGPISQNADGVVITIDISTRVAGAAIHLGRSADEIAITPDGHTAYVTNPFEGTVTPVALATRKVGAPISVQRTAWDVAVAPDGRTAYVVGDGCCVSPAPGTTDFHPTGTLIPIDVASGQTGTPIPVGVDPTGVAITPDGRSAYVLNYGDAQVNDSITVVNLATSAPSDTLHVGPTNGDGISSQLNGIAMSP